MHGTGPSKPVMIGFIGAAVVCVIAIAAVVSIATHPSSAHRSDEAITANLDGCGKGWQPTSAGIQTLTVANTSVSGMEVYLESASTGAVYVDLENLGPGVTRSTRVALAAGRYRFVCLPADADPARGPVVTLSGSTSGVALTPGIRPVTRNDLIPAAKAYEDWVRSRLPVLVADAGRLDADVKAGELDQARSDWLTAHLEYETLGAAYGAFGDYDAEINGMPASGHTAADDPDLAGFHKIEAMLYSGAPSTQIAPVTSALVSAAAELEANFPSARVDPLDVGLRAHEILENALQFELTGEADAESGTELATVDANLTGTLAALAPLRGILATRYPQMKQADAAIEQSRTLVESFRGADGAWRPLSDLGRPQRQQLNASISKTVELLANVAAICDVRRAA